MILSIILDDKFRVWMLRFCKASNSLPFQLLAAACGDRGGMKGEGGGMAVAVAAGTAGARVGVGVGVGVCACARVGVAARGAAAIGSTSESTSAPVPVPAPVPANTHFYSNSALECSACFFCLQTSPLTSCDVPSQPLKSNVERPVPFGVGIVSYVTQLSDNCRWCSSS